MFFQRSQQVFACNLKSEKNICYLCGKTGASSRDHIPPKGIFPKQYNGSLLRLPAHSTCNNVYSIDDETIRNFINLSAIKNPDAKKFWDDHIRRSFIRNPGAKRNLLERIVPVWVRRPHGLGAIRSHGIILEKDLVDRELNRWFKALYFRRHDEPYSGRHTIAGDFFANDIYKHLSSLLGFLKLKNVSPHWTILIPRKLAYFDLWTMEDSEVGMCVFVFYNNVACMITSLPDEYMKKLKNTDVTDSSGNLFIFDLKD